MLSATRSLSKAREAGVPLPEIPELIDLYTGYFRFRPRCGEVTMIAGQPGSQKSGFALWLASRLKLPTWYLSADMAQHTATERLAAAVTGHTTEDVAEGLQQDADEFYAAAIPPMFQFCFNPNPDGNDIAGEMDAWVEAWDSYPKVIVLDNLLDIIPPSGDNEFAGYKAILLEAKTLARSTGAAVFILHHMSEAGTDPFYPAPRKALQGKVSQTPENILSVAFRPDSHEFHVSAVKHRNGPSDASGKIYVTLKALPECNRFERQVPLQERVDTAWQQPAPVAEWTPTMNL